MKLNQDLPIRMLRPVPRSPLTFVQKYGVCLHTLRAKHLDTGIQAD
ncbi:hypothetical protein H6F97_11760 [Microcoleus sp. FACHB-1]|nr:hypothetical protein [Microcoleus sp. FACHB-1]